ncbi:hypothetical protein [Streptomyces antibioticus]|uniref:hypothetical protein n=1 Tax=Streptomyces antibioticus TaxID=1890 RepID=UPI0036DD1C7C
MTTTLEELTAAALKALPVPDLARLSGAQLVGHVCVWGGESLTAGTAVTVGECDHAGRRVFLRGCRRDVARHAMGALFDHSTGAKACAVCQVGGGCPTGRALNLLLRAATS